MSVREDYKAELQSRITRLVRESTGLHEGFAAQISVSITEFFWRELSGERIYFGKRTGELLKKVAAFQGGRISEFCRQQGISRATFYRLRAVLAEMEDEQG